MQSHTEKRANDRYKRLNHNIIAVLASGIGATIFVSDFVPNGETSTAVDVVTTISAFIAFVALATRPPKL